MMRRLFRSNTNTAKGVSGPIGSVCDKTSSHLFLLGSPVASSRYTLRCSCLFKAAVRRARTSSMANNARRPTISAMTMLSR